MLLAFQPQLCPCRPAYSMGRGAGFALLSFTPKLAGRVVSAGGVVWSRKGRRDYAAQMKGGWTYPAGRGAGSV